jgi:hypothetical protein
MSSPEFGHSDSSLDLISAAYAHPREDGHREKRMGVGLADIGLACAGRLVTKRMTSAGEPHVRFDRCPGHEVDGMSCPADITCNIGSPTYRGEKCAKGFQA